MTIHQQPIAARIDWLYEVAGRYSAAYCDPEASMARERHRARHPTALAVMKCMDGRINIPIATNTPPGIIQPFRNLGGFFDLGWPHLGEVIDHYVHDRVRGGQRVLMLITYHFSRGDAHRSCAGFAYQTSDAVAHVFGVKAQVEHVFGRQHGTVYPLVCGFETDEDALILHGPDGRTLDVSTLPATEDEAGLRARLQPLFPDMPRQMLADLARLVAGNIAHVAEVRQTDRQLDIEHREWMICVGRGFDFLHAPNLALIIGPYSPDLADPIRKAGAIIASNMHSGRIPDDGFLLLASSPYQDIGSDRARAELKARFMAHFAAEVIRRDLPDLASRMTVHAAVLNWATRGLESIAPLPGVID
ncbi:MAG: hypothetical protein KAY13_02830 [Zoogloea sp.]|nr:hypothetical protein [Zoogloea sp.]